MLVAESGTMTPNTGRISVIDSRNGGRQTLIDGLPSGVSNLGGPPDTDGTTGIYLQGNTLYVISGVGDACVNVGPGLELPNPAGPSSPIFNSVLEITLPGGYQSLDGGFSLTLSDQATLAGGQPVKIVNQEGKKLNIRMVADLPDYRPEPRPGHPLNVRASHLFGIEKFQKQLYVVDAAFNLIHSVDIETGTEATFTTFPNRANPLFGIRGGPFIEAVPDTIHRVGDQVLVPLLTGFPFVTGLAEVRAIDLKTGSQATVIPGLSSAIDVVAEDGGYYTLEFSANQLANAPGRIRFFNGNGNVSMVAPVVITPTSMVHQDNYLYVTNIFPGTITRVDL